MAREARGDRFAVHRFTADLGSPGVPRTAVNRQPTNRQRFPSAKPPAIFPPDGLPPHQPRRHPVVRPARCMPPHRRARADLRPVGGRPDDLAAARRARRGRRAGHPARPRLEQRDLRERAQGGGGDARGGRPRRLRQGRVPAGDVTCRRPAASAVAISSQPAGSARRSCARCASGHARRRSTALNAPTTAPGGVSRSILSPLSAPPSDKSQQKLATLLEVSKGLTRAVDVDAILDEDRRVRLPDARRGSRRDPPARRAGRAGAEDRARQARRRRAARRAAVDRAQGGRGEGRAAHRRRGAGRPLHRRLDRDAAGALGDLRAADRQRGARARRAVRGHAERDAPLHATRTSSSSSRSPASRRSRSRTRSSPSASGARRSCGATSSATSRRSSPSGSRARRTAIQLGGDKRPVAVLFSDIRGFTALSETMKPDEMASLLTEYFTEMVECVFRHGGTLDKFMGDAVMAQWGAPLGTSDDADRAMRAAIDMMHAMDVLNAPLEGGGPPAARDRDRPQLRRGVRGEHRLGAAARVHGDRRRGQHGVPALRRGGIGADPHHRARCDDALKSPPPLGVCPPVELKGKSQPLPVYCVQL